MKKRRWLAESVCDESGASSYWARVHREGYGDHVFSVASDSSVQRALLGPLLELPGPISLWIPGCGTEMGIAHFLVEALNEKPVDMVLTDFPEVVSQIDAASLPHAVTVAPHDSAQAYRECSFDAALIVNSVVSGEDATNRSMLDSVGKALRENGVLVGLFPTIFVDIDLTSLGHDNLPVIDVRRNLIYEPRQGAWQTAYSPLRLRRVLGESNLEIESMQILFFESEGMRAQAREHYAIHDPDLVLYELLVVARKQSQGKGAE